LQYEHHRHAERHAEKQIAAAMVAVLTRLGLVALIAGLFVRSMLLGSPITRQWDAWYAPTGNFVLALVAALALWGAMGALPRKIG
jgi:protein-S-isoprenylcysteine O-methyltransferase Ste14